MLILVYGGSGSGKSAFAESVCCSLDSGEKLYIATMQVWDEETERRIARHRAMRAEKRFRTAECPVNLSELPLPAEKTLLLECLSNLAANEMFRPGGDRQQAEKSILAGIYRLTEAEKHLVIVSNSVFADGITYDPSTTEYLQLLASLNRQLAAQADAVVEVVCGIPILQKGVLPKQCDH